MIDQLPKDNSISDVDDIVSDQDIVDKVDALPEKEKKQVIAHLEMYSGPLPHPSILKGYDSLDPGAAHKIINNGLAESEHRRMLETKRQKRRGSLATMLLFCGVILILLFMVASFVLVFYGHTIVGSIFGGGSFLMLISTMLTMIPELSGNDDLHSHDDTQSDKDKNDD